MPATDDPRKAVTTYDIKDGKLSELVEGRWFRALEPAHGVKLSAVSGPKVRVVHYRLVDRKGEERNARRVTLKTTGETWWEWEE